MLTAGLVYPVAIAVAIAVGWRGARRLPWWQVASRVALVLYLGWLIGATLSPISLTGRSVPEELASTLNHPNAVPLQGIRDTFAASGVWPRVRLLAGNVLVFVPFGLLAPAVWPRLRRARRMLAAGLLLSAGIELGQLAVSLLLGYWYRMSDVDDVLLNVVGVMAGYAVYLILARWRAPGQAVGRRAGRCRVH